MIGFLNPVEGGGGGTGVILANTGIDATEGAIPFGKAGGGGLDQDASNLFWNNADNRLGVGTNAPSVNFHILKNAIGASTVSASVGSLLENSTSAANGAQQFSPIFVLEGQGFETTGSSSDEVQMGLQTIPVQGTAANGYLGIFHNINGAGFTEIGRFSVDASGREQILASDGIVGAPGFAFIGEPDCGMYISGTNTLAFATTGAQRLTISSVGNITFTNNLIGSAGTIQMPNGSASAPSYTFSSSTTTGMFFATSTIAFTISGSTRFDITSTNCTITADLRPDANNSRDFGSTVRGWRNIFMVGDLFMDTDDDSWITSNTDDEISIFCNSVENLRVDSDATATNTRLLIYDVDNATLERVSVGIDNSGGLGFKVLRIPN